MGINPKTGKPDIRLYGAGMRPRWIQHLLQKKLANSPDLELSGCHTADSQVKHSIAETISLLFPGSTVGGSLGDTYSHPWFDTFDALQGWRIFENGKAIKTIKPPLK